MFPDLAYEIYNTGINSVKPAVLLPRHIYQNSEYLFLGDQQFKLTDLNKLVVIAAGKAAASMSKVAEEQLGALISKGLCITKYGHAVPLNLFETIEAAHPLPDMQSVRAGNKVLEYIQHLQDRDIVLLLLSGGASSLITDIPEGITLEDVQHLSGLLIKSKADICEINTVRKHLSNIKGGHFTKAAFPATVVTLIISDVTGDDTGTIASGPTTPDNTTFTDARDVLMKYGIWSLVPKSIKHHLQKGISGAIEETPKSSLSIFEKNYIKIIGSNLICLEACKKKAEIYGLFTEIITDKMNGDTMTEAQNFTRMMLAYKKTKPACLLMGGETTLQITGKGKGGRNQHFVLTSINEWLKMNPNESINNIIVLSAGTDGTDGPTDAAGAIFISEEIQSGTISIEETEKYLIEFDSYNFFSNYGGLFKTGPTQTNVMDIVIGLVY